MYLGLIGIIAVVLLVFELGVKMGRCLERDDAIRKRRDEGEVTYSSTQATNCAVCKKHKHTPLRVDSMGGYVCLTCINAALEREGASK